MNSLLLTFIIVYGSLKFAEIASNALLLRLKHSECCGSNLEFDKSEIKKIDYKLDMLTEQIKKFN